MVSLERDMIARGQPHLPRCEPEAHKKYDWLDARRAGFEALGESRARARELCLGYSVNLSTSVDRDDSEPLVAIASLHTRCPWRRSSRAACARLLSISISRPSLSPSLAPRSQR